MAADNSSSHHAPEGVTFSDFSGSLVRYFKDLGELDMLSCDEMDTLLLNIDAAYDDIKSHLRRFAFVAAEFQRICSEMDCDCTKSVCMDYFSPSTVKRLFEGDAVAVLSASSQKVEELLDGLKNSFVSGDFSSADLILSFKDKLFLIISFIVIIGMFLYSCQALFNTSIPFMSFS